MEKIAIVYIGVGRYIEFFKDFYTSCEKNFFPGIDKKYFVFTDSEIKKRNVTVIKVKDEGWPYNTLYRFEYFLRIEEELKKSDYIYFFNLTGKKSPTSIGGAMNCPIVF